MLRSKNGREGDKVMYNLGGKEIRREGDKVMYNLEGDKVMYNLEHGARFVFLSMSLKCTDIKVRHKFIIPQIPLFGTNP